MHYNAIKRRGKDTLHNAGSLVARDTGHRSTKTVVHNSQHLGSSNTIEEKLSAFKVANVLNFHME